ncbi:hypothetical protein PAXINDRAFT_103614 [Paxillus involutus ATCC 200175]|uniref:Uncharacterized protein n=1 Tax=Paxillus involutus ATCC 200175 TaxID=664439 RepID=A0A0C9SMA6_PAXIN|nr:hypothetical protein PAXINDRAFT_103614 [Paxillus involutus ATCC 200175]
MTFRANMDTLPWNQSVAVDGLRDWTPVHSLSQFMSRDWLNDSNLNVMLDVMYEQIRVTDVTVEAKYEIRQWHMYDLAQQSAHEHPTLSFYDLESMLMPVTNHSPTPTIGHKSWGSCLDVEDDEGIEELGEDDVATWLDEKVGTHHPHKMCFEMEQEIDLNAAVIMGPLAEAQKPLVIDATDLIDVDAAPAKAEQDLDTAWDW